ncbi:MAG TPA: NADH-quinone oxidoreductase subunit L [Acidimicrobiia bacterium]|nr:NADH-quinone oxidoreductase subunit L [Acidimicrobiia bacterium]
MNARDVLGLVGIVALLPLIGAAFLMAFGRRLGSPRAGWVATGLMALAFAWSVVQLAALLSLPPDARSHVSIIFTWLPADQLHVNIGFLADPLSITWCLLVTGVGTLIHLYAIGYMRDDPNTGRFFAYFNLFAASMLILVLASSYLLTFLGWEGVGLCSYLLIAFWYERSTAALGGKKAFIYNRVGDIGFLIAMFLLIAQFGTLDYGATGHAALHASGGITTAIALLLFLGCTGKSAQIPLFPWLPDAMEGPTPVSALIHAATMVTAGVFLICRAHPFFDASHSAMTVVAWIGAITALVAGTMAVLQPDIKRVLAYSTISQLGYMFLALGTGAYAAAVFFVLMHAFYKACLFLGAGSVIHGNGENQDMRVMGALRRFMPYTAGAMVVAWLAIAGAPPFDGFWAKDGVLEAAYVRHDFGIWAVGIVAAVMTALYMTRLILLTFFGNARWGTSDAPAVAAVSGGSDDDDVVASEDVEAELGYEPDYLPTVVYGEPPRTPRLHGHEPHESPMLMVLPIVTLAVLSIVGGIIDIPLRGGTHLDAWLEPVFRGAPITESFAGAAALSATALAFGAVGILVAFLFYRRGLPSPADDPLQERLGVVGDVIGHGYYYDEAISKAVDGPVRGFATFLDRDVDQRVIDGAVNGTGHLVRRAAEGLRHAQDGLVRRYAIGIALGAAALLLFFLAYAGR